jgi:sugar/nucleoside kinase (ribokinase family)
MTGGDAAGAFVTGEMKKYGVNTDAVVVNGAEKTSFTDVFTVKSTGERTFFNLRGANAVYAPQDVPESALDCEIFHFGYILLMDAFDRLEGNGETALAAFFKKLRARGIKTSIDAVSENGDRFARIVSPALKYCDYAILNEIEAGMVAGIEPRGADGKLSEQNVRRILAHFIDAGAEKVFVHCPEAGFCMTGGKEFVCVPSLKLPKGYIKGTVGAGDAFCAGILYSLYNGFDDARALKTASCVAAANLAASDSVSGARSCEECMAIEAL